jgi:amino acid adenylation domain-containing protein
MPEDPKPLHASGILVDRSSLGSATELASVPGSGFAAVPSESIEAPLSYGQRALWFLQQLTPENAAYNIARAVRVRGPLDVRILEHAFQGLMDHHAMLRATFAAPQGEPVALIHAHMRVHFQEEDASSWDDERLYARLAEELYRPFDLQRGPLMRVSCFRFSPDHHVVMMALHHTVADLWSVAVLLHGLDQLYLAERDGVPPALKPPRTEYADYVRAQEEMLAGPEGERLWAYWREQLRGDLPALNLPTDRPRPAHQTGKGSSRFRRLGSVLTEQLRQLAEAEQVPLHVLLLAAYQVLLHRYTGQDDILVGYPKANRSPRLARVVGYFVNSIVMRANLAGNPTFREFLGQVRQTLETAFAHDELPFALLVERLHPMRDASRSPIFQAMFAWQKTTRLLNRQELMPFALGEADGEMALVGAKLGSMALEQQIAPFDLTLLMAETDTDLVAALEYSSDLFDAPTIQRMLEHFDVLLQDIIADPGQPIGSLSILSATERAQLLHEWNAVAEPFLGGDEASPIPLFEAQVRRAPEAVAVMLVNPYGGLASNQSLNYRELSRRANHLATFLRGHGVGPGVVVGVGLERSLDAVVALLAILKAGGVYLPLDPDYPDERLAFMLRDAGATVLLTQARSGRAWPVDAVQVVAIDGLDRGDGTGAGDGLEHTMVEELAQAHRTLPGPGNLAYVIYTSGSTGMPKGVMVSYGTLTDHCLHVRDHYGLTAEDRVLQFPSLVFDPSLEQILPTLMTGATVVMRGPEMWSPSDFSRRVREFGVTVANLPTAYWQQLVYAWAQEPEAAPSDVLRLMIPGGDTMRPEVVRLWQQTPMRRVKLLNAYGPTETTITATTYEVPEGRTDFVRVPIGHPLPRRSAYVLDQYGNPAPTGVVGELYLGGCGLATGYLNQAEMTEQRFVPDRFSGRPGARLYKTGDLARHLADGNIEFLGRADAQIKVRGFRVELGEIEAVLAQHPDIRQAIVQAREDATGTKYLVAYVVPGRPPAPGPGPAKLGGELGGQGQVGNHELARFLRAKLPEYMVPSSVVMLDTMPLTQTGKVDLRALPIPDAARLDLEHGYVAPRTTLEQQLADLWASVLGVERVGIHDSFFELGGHSLLATQLASRLRQLLQVDVPLRSLFESPTIATLVPVILQLQGVELDEQEEVDEEELARMLDELEQLSDDEARKRLNENA